MFSEVPQHLKADIHSPFPIVNAVCNRTQQGRIFRYNKDAYLILHKSGFGWLSQELDRAGLELLENLCMSELPEYFHIYGAGDALIQYFEMHQNFNIRVRDRIQLCYNSKKKAPLAAQTQPIKPVTTETIMDCESFDIEFGTKFWNNADDFVQFGMPCMLYHDDGKPASLCYAAAISDAKAEIDIVTLEPYRRMGYAKKVTEYFIGRCVKENVTPNWDCFASNTASLSTAESLQFEEVQKYSLISIFNKNKQ